MSGVVRLATVGPLSGRDVERDLNAVMAARPDAVLLRGAVGARDVQQLGAKLAVREAELLQTAGQIGILAGIDTAAAVMALSSLAGASVRLRALVWDAEGVAHALGLADPGATPLRHARTLAVIAAAAAGIPALTMAEPGTALEEACATAARDGFAGLVARDPDEVPVIARWFAAGAG